MSAVAPRQHCWESRSSVPLHAPAYDEFPDEELMRRLADGDQNALTVLHRRHAATVFNISAQTVGRGAAEEICQDVFLAVWRNASAFDPERGAFRPWVLRIAHLRVLNELRRRGRRPQTTTAPDELAVADRGPAVDEMAWRNFQRAALQSAVATLPMEQRQALSLAFFGELTHEQVADFLGVPLGTAKTRIRAGLRRLRPRLLALAAAVVIVSVSVALATRLVDRDRSDPRLADALELVTSSDTVKLRLGPTPGHDTSTHAVYRSKPGSTLAVLTLSNFDSAPAGGHYILWTRTSTGWTALTRSVELDDQGNALVIIDVLDDAPMPSALQITLEPNDAATAPTGPVIVAYPSG